METVDAFLTSGDRNKPNTFEIWVQSRVLQRPIFWWIVSIVGAVVGLIGFGLSSNLKHLLGDPKPWKNVGYTLFCVSVVVFAVVLHRLKGPAKVLPYRRQFKACGVFLALLVIFIYTFSRRGEEQEQQRKGHNDTPNNVQVAGIVSLVGFVVMAFALSIQTNYGFVGELMKFFLEELMVELIKIRWWYGFFGALFSFLLIILHSCKEKHAEGDVHQDPIDNNTTLLLDIRTDSLSTVRPTQDLFTLALLNLNKKDLELSQNLRRHLIGYINDWSDQIPEGIMQDQNFIKDRIRREVETLHLIVNQMTSRDHFEMDNWLVMVYIRSRKQFLLTCESELKSDNSTAQVSRIKKWIKYCNIVLKILIPNERVLCQQVFGEFSPISNKCFEQFCSQVKQDLLSFIQGIPELMSSPEIALLFRIVRDLIVPEFHSLFPHNLSMTIEMIDLTKKLGEATRDYYFRDDDFPPEIENSHSCEPHPITIQVLNRLDIAFKDRDIIEPLLKTYPNSKVQVREEWSLISHYIDWNINKLEASLESTLKKTYIYELQGVSIMANVNYILKKAYEFGFELTKKDGWLKEQASKIQQCFEQYYRENPTELLAFFKQHNEKVTEHSMREMLRLFNFNHLLEKQSYSYQGELILLVNKGFVPSCENFLHRFRTLLNGNEDTHHTYIPTIEDEIEDDVAWR
ncbi:exocyst complex component EXO70A1 [Arachis hypogaea]|uniref:exocyst complex component EXO70A1 n=1 Tax=Arachis hypogaea TaxID=3818 RepID=UPI000DECD6A8|nr:exocyst complex component EXO70A1 [Arachis hypogaea]